MEPSVLFIVSSVTGNQLTRAYPFASALAKLGRKVEIVGPGDPGKDLYVKDPEIEIRRVPDLSLRGKLQWISQKVAGYDVICVTKPCFEGTIAAFAAKRQKKFLVYDLDDDDPRNWLFDVVDDARKFGLRSTLRYIPSAVAIMVNFSCRVLADRISVASHELKRRYGGTVMYVPVDASIFSDVDPVPPGDGVVMYTGAIRAHKGIETLIEAFKRVKEQLPSAKLYLVGPYDEGSYSWRVLKRLMNDVTDIYLTGLQPIQTMPSWLSKADCLVLPLPDNPVHRAQTPVKLLFYMASRRPIVATSVGEVTKLLRDGESALVVPPEDPVSMSKAIVRLLSSRELSVRLAHRALEEFLRSHDLASNRVKLLQFFSPAPGELERVERDTGTKAGGEPTQRAGG